jgi:hypothetical protein
MESYLVTALFSIVAAGITAFIFNRQFRSKIANETSRADELQERVNQLKPELDQVSGELDRVRAEGEKSRNDLTSSQQSNANLKGSYDELIKSKAESKTSFEANVEILKAKINDFENKNEKLNGEISDFKVSQGSHVSALAGVEKSKKDAIELLNKSIVENQKRFDKLQFEKDTLAESVAQHQEADEQKAKEYERRVEAINTLREGIEKDKERERREKEAAEAARLQAMKETWARHEERIEEKIQQLCQRHTIDYIGKEKYPHKGKPDNCITICDQLIIFDSKSPQNDDLSHFPTYIRKQSDDVKKYASQEGVRNEIYLVIPGNAAAVVEETYFDKGSYKVFVITEEALEPIFLTLKRIEDYEFADKLDPADRDKITTILGKMVHGVKRRIQVNQFLNTHDIAVLIEAEGLPKDIFEGAQKVERGTRLNPPREVSTKTIPINELTKDSSKLNQRAIAQGINTKADFAEINKVPLTTEEQGE